MKDLTRGNVYKNFILFAIPMVLAGVFSQAYSIIDTAIAGKFIGESALAAIGATSPLISFISSAFWGFNSGIAVYIAHLFGAKSYKGIKDTILTCVLPEILLMLTIATTLIVFRHQIFSLLKVDEKIYADAMAYFVTYVAGYFLVILNDTGVKITNALGISEYPFYMSLLAALLNVSGNLFTVLYLKWGVFGLAFSSVFSALIVNIAYFIKIASCLKDLGVSRHKARFDGFILRDSSKYTLSNMAQQGIMYTSGVIVSPMINTLGPDATASYTVCLQVYNIIATVYQNSTKTLSNFTAQAEGAGKRSILKKGVTAGLVQSILFALPLVLSCIFLPREIAGIFLDENATPTTVSYSVTFLKYYLPLVLINVLANLFHAFFRGLGSRAPLILSTVFGSLARIIFSYFLIPQMGMQGMFTGWVMFWLFDALCGVLYYIGFLRNEKQKSG